MMPKSDTPSAFKPRKVGRYLLHREIAHGGMATVHIGRLLGQVGFSRTVAIKRMHEHCARDPDFVSMFIDEARLAARIRHPNVVPTLDVVALEGELFLVMEYVQGETLARLIRRSGKANIQIAPRVASSIIAGLLEGLHAAHEAVGEHGEPLGIVHRDVSTQNVMVGNDGVARVLDFGVAKATNRLQTTRDGQIKGKIEYMAPEQIRGSLVDRRTDVYAVACCLWETLAGRRLYIADNQVTLWGKVLEGNPHPPSSLNPSVSPKLDEITMRGLAADPTQRYQTAEAMAIELEQAIGIATPREVGRWVQTLVGKKLRALDDVIAELDSVSTGISLPGEELESEVSSVVSQVSSKKSVPSAPVRRPSPVPSPGSAHVARIPRPSSPSISSTSAKIGISKSDHPPKPEVRSSEKPVVPPPKPAVPAPVKPEVPSPPKPAVPAPVKPEVPTPPKPAVPAPDNPEVPAPPEPAVPAPVEPEVPSPPKPAVPAPVKPEVPSPPKPAVPAPVKPEVPTPPKPAVPAPDNPEVPAPPAPAELPPDPKQGEGQFEARESIEPKMDALAPQESVDRSKPVPSFPFDPDKGSIEQDFPARRSKVGFILGGAAALALLLGVILFSAVRSEEPAALPALSLPADLTVSKPLPPLPEAASTEKASEKEPDPEPEMVRLRLEVSPRTAQTKVDGEERKEREIDLPKSTIPVRIVAEAPGYVPLERVFEPTQDGMIVLELKRIPPVSKPTTTTTVEIRGPVETEL